jgi:predicted phage baseplate assembly protein
VRESTKQRLACRTPESLVSCDKTPPESTHDKECITLQHHSVRTVWEFLADRDDWRRLESATGQIDDDTRAFTLNGRVRVKLPAAMAPVLRAGAQIYYLRCRMTAGSYDATPLLANVAVNGVPAQQTVTPDTWKHSNAEVETLGYGTGRPWQQVNAKKAPVLKSSFCLSTEEDGKLQPWTIRDDFDASGRGDWHYVLDSTLGLVSFGDGEKGRVPPASVPIVAEYLTTRAEVGNMAAGTITRMTESSHNYSLNIDSQFAIPTNPIPATGGSAEETLPHVEGRAVDLMERPNRAVILADYEWFAKRTPGVRLARVSAKANVYPSFPCLKARGMIAVLILPFLPTERPMPSAGLLRTVSAYLGTRRVIGTRVEVFGPTYLEVTVRAKVKSCAGVSVTMLSERIKSSLDRFFHPLTGGHDGDGWPFGRDVFRSEVLQVLDETEGVDHVLMLDLIVGGQPQCGNICLGVTGLVESGSHQIEVT